MSTIYWLESGHADTGFATAANWVGGSAPVDGDSVVFNAGSGQCIGSDQTGLELVTVTVTSGYSGLIGTSGAYLQLDFSKLVFGGLGTANYISNTPDAADAAIIVTGTGSGADALHIDAPAGNGLCTSLTVLAGNVTVDAGAILSVACEIIVGHSGTVNTDADVTIDSGVVESDASVITSIIQYGGTITCASAYATHRMFAGIFTQTGSGGATTGDITTLDLFGGTYNWSGTGTNPTIGTLTQYGGTFSAADASGTIPTIDNIVLYDGDLNLNNGASNIVMGAAIISYDVTPSITMSVGQTWTIA